MKRKILKKALFKDDYEQKKNINLLNSNPFPIIFSSVWECFTRVCATVKSKILPENNPDN